MNTSKKTGNESNSTDKEVLHELALDGYENARHIHEYRQALNRCTKFVNVPRVLVAMERQLVQHLLIGRVGLVASLL